MTHFQANSDANQMEEKLLLPNRDFTSVFPEREIAGGIDFFIY